MTTESEPMLRPAPGCDTPSGEAPCSVAADGTAADGVAAVPSADDRPAADDASNSRPAAGGACPLGAGAGEGGSRIERIEPPSWWVGMRTPLQLLVKGRGIASWQVEVDGCEGVRVAALHPGTSPNYLFVDVAIAPTARPGRRGNPLPEPSGHGTQCLPDTMLQIKKGRSSRLRPSFYCAPPFGTTPFAYLCPLVGATPFACLRSARRSDPSRVGQNSTLGATSLPSAASK